MIFITLIFFFIFLIFFFRDSSIYFIFFVVAVSIIESCTAAKPAEGVDLKKILKTFFVISLNPIHHMCSELLDHVDHRILVKSGLTVGLCFLVTKSFSYYIQRPDH